MPAILFTTAMLVFTMLHIRAEFFGPTLHILLFKPLSVACIPAMALTFKNPASPTYKRLILLGLAFSLAGDAFLMPWQADTFIFGLGSFLLAHVIYIPAFAVGVKPVSRIWTFLPFALFGIGVFLIIRPGLEGMKIPVLVYLTVILLMARQALERHLQQKTRASLAAFSGTLLFLASDTLLAFNRFYYPLPLSPMLIMWTYLPAQWLIAVSIETLSPENRETAGTEDIVPRYGTGASTTTDNRR